MDGIYNLFGGAPSYLPGLLGEDEARRLQEQSRRAGLAGLGLSLLSGGGQNLGQMLAQGVAAGQQASRNAYEQAVKDKMLQEQIAEQQQARQEALAARQILPTLIRQPIQEVYGEDIMGQRVGEGVKIGQPQLDVGALSRLFATAPGVASKVLPSVEAFRKLSQPEEREVGGVLYQRQDGGGWKEVAGQRKRNTVTVGNTVLDQDTMQVIYTAPDAPAASIKEFQDFQKLTPAQQREYLSLQAGKRPVTTINMPSEGERKAAVLSNRLNFSVSQMNKAIGADPNAALPSTKAEFVKYVTGSDFLSNKLTPEQRQVVEAAQLDILDAALTLGTGAAYTQGQLEGYRRSYFPQLNDKPEQIKTKQERLQNILRSAEIAAGRAAPSIPTEIPRPPAGTVQLDEQARRAAQEELRKRGEKP